jgi:hypothetical protein
VVLAAIGNHMDVLGRYQAGLPKIMSTRSVGSGA